MRIITESQGFMSSTDTIEHSGTVQSIEGKYVNVRIVSHPSCVGCASSGVCEVSENEEKVIQVLNSGDVKTGDKVMVVMESSLGFRALFIGYLLPFLVVLFLLVLLTSLSVPELTAGLVSLLSLVPYYIVVYLSREKIRKRFSFTIKKIY